MKVVILYRPNSEFARITEEFIADFKSRVPDVKLEVQDVDSREGSSTANLYDIMQYPAILVLAEDGHLQNSWLGERLPLIDEVAAYSVA